MALPNPYTNKETWADTITHAFNCPDDELEETLLRLYTKQSLSIVKVNENSMTWEPFVALVRKIRADIASIKVTSTHWVREGNMLANRHTVVGRFTKDGTTGPGHAVALIMAELDDNDKAIWLEEISQVVTEAKSAEQK